MLVSSLHGWSTWIRADLKPGLLSSKSCRGFHCKLMRSLLQRLRLGTDRASINQANHNDMGEDIAINSTGTINVQNLSTSVDATCLALFHANGTFLLLSFYPSSSWFQRLPCQHLSFHDFNSRVTLILHRLPDDCSTLQMEFRISKVIDRKRIRVEDMPLCIIWLCLSTNTCCTCQSWVLAIPIWGSG